MNPFKINGLSVFSTKELRAVCDEFSHKLPFSSIGRLIRTDISEREGGAYVGSTEYGYDPRGNMTSIQNEIGGVTYTQSHIYAQTKDENDEVIIGTLANSKDGLPTRYSIFSNRYADYYYDSLSRRTMRKFRVGTTNDPVFLYNLYTYKDSQRNASGSDTYQTTLLESETVAGTVYAYEYDKVGNITEITRNDKAYHSYKYDKFGQLVRDDSATGGTYTWTYDDLGNITSRKKYAYTTGDISSATPSETIEYHYGKADNAGWNNILTGVDFNGNGTVDETEKILYDEIGNPTTYLGANMWWKGRQLTSYRKNGVDLLFTYDASGLRGSKTVGSVKTTYQYVGDKLYYENRGNGKELYYFYDSFNNLSAISYFNGKEHTMYYALTNSQGDVLGLYDAWGKKVAAYDYDAWGNATVYEVTQDENGNNVHTVVTEETDHISYVNPIRYRGYYYDDDLKLYYLQSRYYDSTVGRFINADGYITTGQGVLSYNMFSYCGNNPVNCADPTGMFWKEIIEKISSAWNNFTSWCSNKISPNHDVPLYEQGNTNLCWAYSQIMVEDSLNDTIRTQGEADTRARELGEAQNGVDNWDGPGWPTNVGEQIIINDFYDVAIAVIDNPVYAQYSSSTSIDHLVVVTGVSLKNKTIFVNNPWGENGELTYDEFIQGFPGENENINDFTFSAMWDVAS